MNIEYETIFEYKECYVATTFLSYNVNVLLCC